MTRLAGRVALITGAGAGIGAAAAEVLAEQGADVIALDRDAAAAERTAGRARAVGRRAAAAGADVRDGAALRAAVDAAVAELGRLDIVVTCAGVCENTGPAWEIDEDAWERSLDVNLTGTWHAVAAAAPALHAAGGGSIVLVASSAGVKAVPGAAQYSAAKHGVVGMMRTLANELGAQSIRVNAVLPGPVNTAMTNNPATFARLRPDLDEPGEADVAPVLAARNLLPMAWAEPADIANAVAFLASDDARCVTGQQLVVDAGLTQKVA